MSLARYFPLLLGLHVGCVGLSGLLFTTRALLRIAHVAAANHLVLRITSWVIDTTLLVAALLLTRIVHQYPFVNAWLTVKLVLLVLYIGLGTLALRRARSTAARATALCAALITYAFIIGVAVTANPWGWFSL